MKNEPKTMIGASFYATAAMKCSFSELKTALKPYGYRLLGEGTRLRYEVGEPDDLLELGKDSIIFTFYVAKPNFVNKCQALLRFFQLLEQLKGVYDVKAESLYRYVTDILLSSSLLSNEKIVDKPDSLTTKIDSLSRINAKLANEFYNTTKARNDFAKERDIYRKFCIGVLRHFSDGKAVPKKENLMKFGIAEEDSVEMAAFLEEKIKNEKWFDGN